MAIRISELEELSVDLSQSDSLPIVDISAGETKQITVGNILNIGISGAPSSFIDLAKLNQSSTTKLSSVAFANTGVASGTYGSASTVPQFTVNPQGVVTFASGIPIAITAGSVSGLAAVATSGTYASLTGLPTLGTLSSQDAGSVVISGGTISGVTFLSGNVTISGGTISGIVDLAVADGGTGASTASGARTNLGLAIGTDVQAYSSVLAQLSTSFGSASVMPIATSSGVVSNVPAGAVGLAVLSGSTASGIRSTIGLGTISTQDASSVVISGGTISGVTFISNNVAIGGGTISGITDLAIADGGTGASTASGARTNLGLAIGSDVQAYSAVLSGVVSAFDAANVVLYSSASGVTASTAISSFGRSLIAESGASSLRTTLGLGSMALQNAASVVISGGTISGITDLSIADGGTGASTAADARTNLGLVIGTDVQAYDPALASIAGLTTSADQLIYTTGSDSYATSSFPSYARGLIASGSSSSAARAALGLGVIATRNLVVSGDIDNQAVTGANIASGSIISSNYGAESILAAAIASGAVTEAKIATSGITASKLANNSAGIVGTGSPITAGSFIGQSYFDDVTSYQYIWDGSAWNRQAAISTLSFVDSTPIAFAVSYPDEYSATITTTLDNQNANLIFAGPASGSATSPSFRSLVPADLPLASSGTTGAVKPGAGMSVDGAGNLGHSNVAAAGTYAGPVTIDAQGHIVTAQPTLSASDIPSLDASKITTGTFGSAFLAENSVTASQLADYGIAQVSESAPIPEFAGQWWINPNDRSAYIWVGVVSPQPEGYWLNLGYGSPTQINLRFGGTYNASGNTVESINAYGIEAGLTVGQALSAPNTANNGVYLIVTASGTGTTPAPNENLTIGNWVLSQGVGSTWTKVNLSSAVAGVGDQDVLVDGGSLVPTASGVASQEDLNELLWGRAQIANLSTAGIVRASSEIVVASGTGIMSVGIVDDGTF